MHTPVPHIRQLLESLCPDKLSVGFLLGAGCPMSVSPADNASGPLIPDISGLTKEVEHQLTNNGHQDAFAAVSERLGAEATIEDFLSHIRVLRQVVGGGKIDGLDATTLDELDRVIGDTISACVDKELPSSGTSYHQLARWIGGIDRRHPVEIFTTNYDLLMEQALEALRVPYFDGFIGSHHAFFDSASVDKNSDLPPRWTPLPANGHRCRKGNRR